MDSNVRVTAIHGIVLVLITMVLSQVNLDDKCGENILLRDAKTLTIANWTALRMLGTCSVNVTADSSGLAIQGGSQLMLTILSLETGQTDQHTGQTDQHTGQTDQHTRQTYQHTGQTDQHTDQHTRQTDQHTRQTDQHTVQTDQHARQTDQHTGQTDQHTRQTDQHARQTDQHTGQTYQHIRQTDQHTRQTDQHTRQTDQHPGQTEHAAEAHDTAYFSGQGGPCPVFRLDIFNANSKTRITPEGGVCGNHVPSTHMVTQEHTATIQMTFNLTSNTSMSRQHQLLLLAVRFHSNPCDDSQEFECDNERCVSSSLTCNGQNDCGDKSDETDGCLLSTPVLVVIAIISIVSIIAVMACAVIHFKQSGNRKTGWGEARLMAGAGRINEDDWSETSHVTHARCSRGSHPLYGTTA